MFWEKKGEILRGIIYRKKLILKDNFYHMNNKDPPFFKLSSCPSTVSKNYHKYSLCYNFFWEIFKYLKTTFLIKKQPTRQTCTHRGIVKLKYQVYAKIEKNLNSQSSLQKGPLCTSSVQNLYKTMVLELRFMNGFMPFCRYHLFCQTISKIWTVKWQRN